MAQKEHFELVDNPNLSFTFLRAAVELNSLQEGNPNELDPKPVHNLADLLTELVHTTRERRFMDPLSVVFFYELLLPEETHRNYNQLLGEIEKVSQKLQKYPNISAEDSKSLGEFCIEASRKSIGYRAYILGARR